MNIIILLFLIFSSYVHEVPLHFFLPTRWSSKNSTLFRMCLTPLSPSMDSHVIWTQGLYNLMLPILYIYCHGSDPVPQPFSQPLAAVHIGLSMWPSLPLNLLAFLSPPDHSHLSFRSQLKNIFSGKLFLIFLTSHHKPLYHHLPLLRTH